MDLPVTARGRARRQAASPTVAAGRGSRACPSLSHPVGGEEGSQIRADRGPDRRGHGCESAAAVVGLGAPPRLLDPGPR